MILNVPLPVKPQKTKHAAFCDADTPERAFLQNAVEGYLKQGGLITKFPPQTDSDEYDESSLFYRIKLEIDSQLGK